MLSTKQTQENTVLGAECFGVVKQLVDIEILYLLTFSPKSGYELKKQLMNWFKVNVSYGTLYPHLHSLEKTGFIVGAWHQKLNSMPLKKRLYTLTQTGKEVLRGSIESLTRITLTMQFMMTRVNMGAQIPSTFERESALARLENYFVARDYGVRKSVVIRGFSGVEYPIDLLASSPGSKPHNVIVRMVDRSPLTIDDVLKTHVMSFDLEASCSVILSASAVSEEITKLAEFYHISIYGGPNLENAIDTMCSSFNA